MGIQKIPFSYDRKIGERVLRVDFYQAGYFAKKPIQSMCWDPKRKRYFIGFSNHDDANLSNILVMKDLKFLPESVEKIAANVHLEHCNDMAYDPIRDRIMVAGGNQWVGVLNPESLAVEEYIPAQSYVWSIARYSNGDYFVHDGDRGLRYDADFKAYSVLTTGNKTAIQTVLKDGCWQGAVMIEDIPYMMYDEFREDGLPCSCALFSCDQGENRTIYRMKTNYEVENCKIIDGKMIFLYGNYYVGGLEWDMNEILSKQIDVTTDPMAVTDRKVIKIDLSRQIPDNFELVSAIVSIHRSSTWRQLPCFSTDGEICTIRVQKVEKNKVYIYPNTSYLEAIFHVTGFCRKKV